MTGGLGAYINPKEAAVFRGILQDSVVFKGLSTTLIELFLDKGMILEAKKGDIVAYEEMPGGIGIYIVLEGKVDVFRAIDPANINTRQNQIHLNTLTPGQCFGEYSLLDGKATSASAMALTSSRLFFLPRVAFLQLLKHEHEAGKIIFGNLLLYLVARLRQKDEELRALS